MRDLQHLLPAVSPQLFFNVDLDHSSGLLALYLLLINTEITIINVMQNSASE